MEPPNDTDRLVRAVLASVTEVGTTNVARLLTAYEAPELLDRLCRRRLPRADLTVLEGRLGDRDPAALGREILDRTAEIGARLIVPGDDEWPGRLDDLGADGDGLGPPICLWARGPLTLAGALERSVSIVGARASTEYGRTVALDLAAGVGERGWSVVSGGAVGIDAAAHRGALHAEAPTIAVLACGLDIWYPQANAGLLQLIAERGLLLSEWPPGSVPLRHRFLVRNRVIAAATLGTVVVEAAPRSGARNTAGHAVNLDRTLMVVPGPLYSTASAGVHRLAREPGGARLVTSAAEIIEDVGRLGDDLAPPPRTPSTVRDELSAAAARVLDAVPRRSAATADEIAAQAGLGVREARRALPGLLRRGLVDEHDGLYQQASSPRRARGRDDTGSVRPVMNGSRRRSGHDPGDTRTGDDPAGCAPSPTAESGPAPENGRPEPTPGNRTAATSAGEPGPPENDTAADPPPARRAETRS